MADEPRPAHEVLLERISQHAEYYDLYPKCNERAYPAWIRLTEACATLLDTVVPEEHLGEVIERLHVMDQPRSEEVSLHLHQLANDLERRLEDLQKPSR